MKWLVLVFLFNCSPLAHAASTESPSPKDTASSPGDTSSISDDDSFMGRFINEEQNAEILYTPGNLMRAIERDDRNLAEKLIRAGVDRNCVVPMLDQGDIYDAFQLAVYKRHHSIAKMLLEFGTVESKGRSRMKGYTALHIAAFQGDFNMVTELLDRGFDENAMAKDGSLPIFYAINCPQIFTLLLPRSNLAAIDSSGRSLLLHLILNEKFGLAELLVPYENIAINHGTEPAILLVANACKSDLTDAAAFSLFKLLLEHPKVNLQAVNVDGCNIFHIACQNSHLGMMELCCTHFVNPVLQDSKGKTPAEYLSEPTLQQLQLLEAAKKAYKVAKVASLLINAAVKDDACIVFGVPNDIMALIGANFLALQLSDQSPEIGKYEIAAGKRAQKKQRCINFLLEYPAPVGLENTVRALIQAITVLDVQKSPATWGEAVQLLLSEYVTVRFDPLHFILAALIPDLKDNLEMSAYDQNGGRFDLSVEAALGDDLKNPRFRLAQVLWQHYSDRKKL
jgi:ankyrin repeat protein